VTVNERDEIGDDLVPDYMTSLREGGFYGWPYSYSAGMSAFAPSRRGRTSSPVPSSPTMLWGRRVTGAHLRSGLFASAAIPRRRLRWPARLVEPKRAQRL
jgi:glucose/arabinose dehydrogenase